MILRFLFVGLAILVCWPAQAADATSCGELPCRANGLPYVTPEGIITIQPGEKFWVELKIEAGKVTALFPRKEADTPSTIQLELFVKSGATALIWGNQLDRPVRFDATATAPRRVLDRLDCPLPPKKYTYQVWDFVAETVEIGSFNFAPSSDPKCT